MTTAPTSTSPSSAILPPEPQIYSLVFDVDGEAFGRYVAYEVERLKAKAAHGNDRPAGLRLSTECPTRRVREWWDERYRLDLDEGLAERGFEMESRFRACMPQIVRDWQVPITWSAGTSAWDAIDFDGNPVSLKSAVGKKRPSSANTRQDDRMMVAAGYQAGAVVDTYMVDPSWLTAYGPIRHTLTEERRGEVVAELEGAHAAHEEVAAAPDKAEQRLDDPAFWEAFGLACNCGACLRRGDAVDADDPLEQLATRWDLARAGEVAAKAEVEQVREQIIAAATIRLRVDPDARQVRTYWPPLTISQNRAGVWAIRRRRE